MGVRSYVPALGRFTSTDPIPGGSANAYDYAAADPVKNFDLDGRRCTKHSATKTWRIPTGYKATVCSNGTRKLRRIVNSRRYNTAGAMAEAVCSAFGLIPSWVGRVLDVGCTYIVKKSLHDLRNAVNRAKKRQCVYAEWGVGNVLRGHALPRWGVEKAASKKCRRR